MADMGNNPLQQEEPTNNESTIDPDTDQNVSRTWLNIWSGDDETQEFISQTKSDDVAAADRSTRLGIQAMCERHRNWWRQQPLQNRRQLEVAHMRSHLRRRWIRENADAHPWTTNPFAESTQEVLEDPVAALANSEPIPELRGLMKQHTEFQQKWREAVTQAQEGRNALETIAEIERLKALVNDRSSLRAGAGSSSLLSSSGGDSSSLRTTSLTFSRSLSSSDPSKRRSSSLREDLARSRLGFLARSLSPGSSDALEQRATDVELTTLHGRPGYERASISPPAAHVTVLNTHHNGSGVVLSHDRLPGHLYEDGQEQYLEPPSSLPLIRWHHEDLSSHDHQNSHTQSLAHRRVWPELQRPLSTTFTRRTVYTAREIPEQASLLRRRASAFHLSLSSRSRRNADPAPEEHASLLSKADQTPSPSSSLSPAPPPSSSSPSPSPLKTLRRYASAILPRRPLAVASLPPTNRPSQPHPLADTDTDSLSLRQLARVLKHSSGPDRRDSRAVNDATSSLSQTAPLLSASASRSRRGDDFRSREDEEIFILEEEGEEGLEPAVPASLVSAPPVLVRASNMAEVTAWEPERGPAGSKLPTRYKRPRVEIVEEDEEVLEEGVPETDDVLNTQGALEHEVDKTVINEAAQEDVILNTHDGISESKVKELA